MYKLFSVAAVVASASAASYRFQPDNDVANPVNWVSGAVPTGNMNLNSPCGTGPTSFSLNSDLSVGGLEFPDNGEFVLIGDLEIEFSDDASQGDWRCKTGREMDAGCSNNFEVLANGTWVQSNTAPGFGDVVEFSSDKSFSFYTRGDFYSEVVFTGSNPQTFTSSLGAFEDFWNNNPYQFRGSIPTLGSSTLLCGGSLLSCQSLNSDNCNAMELETAIVNPSAFWELDEAERNAIILDAEAELDQIINMRQGIVNDFKGSQGAFMASANSLQDQYESSAGSGSGSAVGPVGGSTLESIKVTSDQMVAWMEATSVGTAAGLHALKNDLTVKQTQLTWNWYANPNNTLDLALWEEIDNKDSFTTTDPLAVLSGPANGRARRQYALPPGATLTAQQVTDFVLLRVNTLLSDISSMRGQAWTVTAVYWGGAVPESQNANFAAAAGAFQFIGMDISGAPTMEVAGETVPAIAPEILEAVFASTLVQMSLYARESHLRELLHNQPTMAPEASEGDETDIMDYIPFIAAGAGVLLICGIVAVVIASGKNDDEPKNDRSVVSFENPMYDDPAAVPEAGNIADGGLYDEPTFNEKSNPTYASNEDTADGGGYLDVEPDDGDDDEEEEDEDEDEEDEDEDDEDE